MSTGTKEAHRCSSTCSTSTSQTAIRRRPRSWGRSWRRSGPGRAELRAAGAWVFTGGLHPASTATVVRVRDGDAIITDGPFAEGKEHLGGFTVIAAPDLDAALDWGRKLADVTGLPIEVWPLRDGPLAAGMPARPGPEIERVFRDEYGRAVSVLVRAFGDIDIAEDAVQDAFAQAVTQVAGYRPAAQPGRLDHHHGPQPGHRPAAPGGVPGRPAGRGGPAACGPGARGGPARQRRTRGGGTRARRPAAPDLHLLPPGARRQRPGRADAAPARRAEHRGDSPRVPGVRADHGPAAGPGQGQDPGRPDPVPGAGRGRAARAAARRAGRGVPDLQRGLRGQLRRPPGPGGPVCRGHPARPAAGRADARRAGGPGAARADAADRVPAGRADHRGRGTGAAGRPGPWPLGPSAHRRGPGHRPAVPAPGPARALPDPGGDRRRAQRHAARQPAGPAAPASTGPVSRPGQHRAGAGPQPAH